MGVSKLRLLHGSLLLLLLASAAVQAQRTATRTDPAEAAAVNAVFAKLGQSASSSSSQWNISGDPCTGAATDGTVIDDNPNFNPAIKCDCSFQNNTICRITKLNLGQNILSGTLPSFIGELTNMQNMTFRINSLSGPIPKELGNLTNLVSLGLGSNRFNGSLPSELGNLNKLQELYIDSAGLSGPLPSSLSTLTRMQKLWASDNDFTGQIPDYIGSWNLTDLRFQGNSFQGPIPAALSNLVQLSSLILRNCRISDNLASVDFSKFASLSLLDLSFNNITGQVPEALLGLNSLNSLDFSYNQLSGNFPPWVSDRNLQLNLVANNFVFGSSNNSVLPSGLECLQRNTPCLLASTFAVNCGSNRFISGSDNLRYQTDDASLAAASYSVTGAPTWGVSNVGKFVDAPNGSYIIYSSRQFQNTLDSELFQTSRMSPSSLRYYGIGLENGNYTVTLQFAEFGIEDTQSWKSLGRRVFDIYVQGERMQKNFDIRKEALDKSYSVVRKPYKVRVTKNFLEIHLFWAGKGTCCIPNQGYYGPTISALSVTPDFAPTVGIVREQNKSTSKTGVIVGVVVGVTVLGLAALVAIFLWRQKRRKLSLEQQELYSIVGRPNVFSYSELRSATENFSSSNRLGEGGYGAVYKGKLTDGRVVAVKQLSQTSHQGKKQFATEIETISRVQHRNLVKLYGCCLEGNNPLLVYEYMENGSLDKALFGTSYFISMFIIIYILKAKVLNHSFAATETLNIDWPARFEICLGIARGLAYLHEESSIRVVHRDIKASNVLLDANLNPKISDFGLAKLYDDKKTHVSTKVAGTFGYLAPEYAMRGHMTEKVDVFAFGVVLLETVAGRPNYDDTLEEDKIYIFEWAWELYENNQPLGIVDPKLTGFNREEVLRAIHVALLCTQGSPHQRPPMSRIVSMLTGDSEVPNVLTKPSYITEWQIKGGNTSLANSAVSAQSGSPLVPPSQQASSLFLNSVIQEGR
uniref:non-specific serine/threonine protein kinase n=1 Tax=Leersia perrieri TaxID=77586 RepID=A0A0D9W9H7_9ORYZ